MSAQKRLPPWHEKFRLRDGRELLIRPIRQEDAAPIRGAFLLLEPQEIRQRFLTTMAELPAEQAARLCSPDPRSDFALVAAEPLPPGEALVGAVARARVPAGARHAECAILVSRFIAGQGVGRHLMRRLVKWARGRDLQQLHGDVLDDNQPMLQLVKSLGFRVLPGHDTPGLARVVLDLETAAGKTGDPDPAPAG
jgi:RimJ/RimL family protein N-acetyltransferase